VSGFRAVTMINAEVVDRIIETLAIVRATSAADLRGEIEAVGMEDMMVSSHEVVTVLVMLQPASGIDPTDPDVLKGCNLQSLSQLVAFVDAAAEAAG
jgi:hypothetical protein